MNVCKVFNVDLLLFVMKPVELISKQFTLVECSVMSVTKGAYFLLFSLCRWSMLDVSGTVSNLRVLSGKFLRQQSCYPESFRFF